MKNILVLSFFFLAINTFAQTKLTIQSSDEKVATIGSNFSARNTPQGDEGFVAAGGLVAQVLGTGKDSTFYAIRSFLQFDLSSIPQGSFVNWARLTLFTDTAYGSGSFLLRRITSGWNQNMVTWNTRPKTAVRGTIRLPINSANGNLRNLNVTNLVQTMVDSPATSFGFALKIDSDANRLASFPPLRKARSVTFMSPAFHRPHYNPKLVMEYTAPGLQPAVTSMAVDNGLSTEMTIYPNPCNKTFNCNIRTADPENMTLRVMDMLGRTIYDEPVNASGLPMRVNLPTNSAGTYFVVLQNNKNETVVSQQVQVN